MSHHKLFSLCGLGSWLSLMMLSLPCHGAPVDLDGNGLDDFWEQIYSAGGLNAGADTDYDGRSNAEEDLAGTDPLNRNSKLTISHISISGGSLTATFVAMPGKRYRLRGGAMADGSDFTELGTLDAVTENGSITASVVSPESGFFEITAENLDSDNDGLDDWTELQLDGYDINDSNSWSPDLNDREIFIQTLQAQTGEFQVTAIQAEAFEVGGDGNPAPASLTISRTGGVAPVTLFYSLSGSSDPEKEPALASDYGALSGMINFEGGQASAQIEIVPVADAIHEFPNSLLVSIDAHSDYVIGPQGSTEVTIFDATDDPSKVTNFLGQFAPERGSITSASGYSWIKLNGKKNIALVTSQFSGLTTVQTAAHIHQSTLAGDGVTITNGPVMESLPIGQFVDYTWNIGRTGALSPQDLIDSLYGQNGRTPLYANAHSMRYPGGEIWGFFSENTGSPEFVVPEDPPPIEPLSGDELTRDVSRFLTQATFGPTADEITALADDITNNHGGDRIGGYEAWIDAQFALDQTRLYDITYAADQQEWALNGNNPIAANTPEPNQNNRRTAFWHVAMQSHDQLRQRLAFALNQIIVVSEQDATVGNRHYGTAKFYDMLGDHCDGNFLTILRDVSKSPIMGQYLSSLKNGKAVLDGNGEILIAPDENYAREIMQLFSIGLLFKHPDGSLVLNENGLPIQTYTNTDITELARVFTGWSFSKRVGSSGDGYPTSDNTSFNYYGGPQYFQASWENPMINFSAYHDTDAKNVLGSDIAAGQSGEADLNSATNILFSHQNTGPFIGRLLIQRLVTSNPSAGYIYRVGQAFTSNAANGEQMKEVFKAILLDYEARSLTQIDNAGYGKQKEPLMRFGQLVRALGATSEIPLSDLANYGYPANQMDNFPPDAKQLRWTTHTQSWFSQSHLNAPSVFNWFLPDHKAGGALQEAGLVAPEFAITNEYQVIRWDNYAWLLVAANGGLGARELPNQRETVANGGMGDTTGVLDNITIAAYVDSLEAMVQGFVTGGDTEEVAWGKLLDHLDVLLCAGRLKEKYGSSPDDPNPRKSILDHAIYVFDPANPSGTTERAVEDMLYHISTSPEFITQK